MRDPREGRLWGRRRAGRWGVTVVCLFGLIAAVTVHGEEPTPEATVRQYIQALYSRNYVQVYPLIAATDRQHKSQETYLKEHGSFTGISQELASQLASYITIEHARTEVHGDRATVVVHLTLPDGNDPTLRTLLLDFEESRLRVLPAPERQQLIERLRAMHQRGELPVISGEERFALVKEAEGWRVLLGWDGAVLVRFTGEVATGLPWEFAPQESEVRAPPGETLQTAYRVRNLSDARTTGKARTVILPSAQYLEVIQCFCFIEQTLGPGEEKEFPLTFRVTGEQPSDLRVIELRYEFYSPEHFRPEWKKPAAR